MKQRRKRKNAKKEESASAPRRGGQTTDDRPRLMFEEVRALASARGQDGGVVSGEDGEEESAEKGSAFVCALFQEKARVVSSALRGLGV